MQRLWAAPDSGFMPSKSEFSEWLEFASACNAAAGANLHWDALTSDFTHIVKSMNCKVLILAGDSTIAASSIRQRMRAAVPPCGAHFELFAGGTHCLHHQPEHLPRLNSLIEQLLNGSLENNTSGIGGSGQPSCNQPLNVLGDATRALNRLPNQALLKKHTAFWHSADPKACAGTACLSPRSFMPPQRLMRV